MHNRLGSTISQDTSIRVGPGECEVAIVGVFTDVSRDGESLRDGVYAFFCALGGWGEFVKRRGTAEEENCSTPECKGEA